MLAPGPCRQTALRPLLAILRLWLPEWQLPRPAAPKLAHPASPGLAGLPPRLALAGLSQSRRESSMFHALCWHADLLVSSTQCLFITPDLLPLVYFRAAENNLSIQQHSSTRQLSLPTMSCEARGGGAPGLQARPHSKDWVAAALDGRTLAHRLQARYVGAK